MHYLCIIITLFGFGVFSPLVINSLISCSREFFSSMLLSNPSNVGPGQMAITLMLFPFAFVLNEHLKRIQNVFILKINLKVPTCISHNKCSLQLPVIKIFKIYSRLTPIHFVNSITALLVDWYMGKTVLDSPTIDATLITAEFLSTLFSMYLRPSMVPWTTAFYNIIVV